MTGNKPYVKKIHGDNCPPQNKPNRKSRRGAGKYIVLRNPLTQEFVGRVKVGGNNRKPNRKGSRTFRA